jgi:hypothetical protein
VDLIPPQYHHDSHHDFFTNITGFHRLANLHPLNLLSPEPTSSFFHGLETPFPNLNDSNWNATLAASALGTLPWSTLDHLGFNLKERPAEGNNTGYNWVKGGLTLFTGDTEEIEFNFYGVHQVETGKIGLWGLPDGMRIDIRNLTRAWASEDEKAVVRQIINGELERELRTQRENLMLSEVRPDGEELSGHC